ncbi:MAG: hypothetical protein QXX76_00110 [Archaeoglobaceae archaeon]
MDLREDEGVEILGVRIRCDYIGYINGKAVVAIEKATKNNEVSSLEFAKAYARFRGFRYAGIISEDLKLYDLKENKFVDDLKLDFIEPDEKFGRLALLFFECTQCECKRSPTRQ